MQGSVRGFGAAARALPFPVSAPLGSLLQAWVAGWGGGWVVPGAPGQPFRALSPAAASQCWLRDPRPPRAHHLPYTLDSAPRR